MLGNFEAVEAAALRVKPETDALFVDGLSTVIATQNPMDLDHRVLSNAGFWCIGRLSTDADRNRVVEAMSHTRSSELDADSLAAVIKSLAPRWFVMRNARRPKEAALLNSRTRCVG